MAYGNWGAFVYRNGKRMRFHEDATPYKEHKVPGYHQAFGLSASFDNDGEVEFYKDNELSAHHAVLGSDRVRLCGYKHLPYLYVDGEKVPLDQYVLKGEWPDDRTYEGMYEDYYFWAEEYNGNMLELVLIEPDGSHWRSTCGYMYGAGHMEDDN